MISQQFNLKCDISCMGIKSVRREENTDHQHFLLFFVATTIEYLNIKTNDSSTPQKNEEHCMQVPALGCNCLICSENLKFKRNHICFNPIPNKPWFLRVCSTYLLKTLWEKEKFLPTWITFLPFFIKMKIVVSKLFQFEESKICPFGKD